MRVIVVGAGEVGYHVADRLSTERHDVVVVDVDAARLEYVQSHIDVAVVEGSGTSPGVLREAGIDEAGLLLAVTSVDEVNLVCAMSVAAVVCSSRKASSASSRSGLISRSTPKFSGRRPSRSP